MSSFIEHAGQAAISAQFRNSLAQHWRDSPWNWMEGFQTVCEPFEGCGPAAAQAIAGITLLPANVRWARPGSLLVRSLSVRSASVASGARHV